VSYGNELFEQGDGTDPVNSSRNGGGYFGSECDRTTAQRPQ